MPVTEQTTRKILLIIFIALAVIGALFMVFVFFFNRGTLTVISSAPFSVEIAGIKTEVCATDACSTVLAPGDYTIILKKAGYRDVTRRVSVPIGGERKEEAEFEFIPALTLKGSESDLKLFAGPQVTAEDLPESGVFREKNYLAFIARDPDTHRHTLYIRSIEEGKAGEKTAVTSFIRDIKSYILIPAIETQNKIALIDGTAGTSTLYMIDLTKKSRENLFTYPLISGVKWVPDSSDFLFEARAEGDLSTSIFLHKTAAKEPIKLELKTLLKNVIPVSKDRLIAATNQYIAAENELAKLEGQLVTLGEAEATPAVTALAVTAPSPALNFIDYSLLSNQGRLLKTAPDLAYPQEGTLSETQKSAYFLIEGKVYELQFMDHAN